MKLRDILYRFRGLCFKLLNRGESKSIPRIGKGVSVNISTKAKLQIGNKLLIEDNCHIGIVEEGCLSIGDNCFINRNCIIACRKSILICSGCIFGPGVTIYDHDHKFSKDGVAEGYNIGEVVIGEGTWVGANVTILRGSHIGKKCVIGAGCVIKGNIPDHTLVTSDRTVTMIPIV